MKRLIFILAFTLFSTTCVWAKESLWLFSSPLTGKALHDAVVESITKAGFLVADDRDMNEPYLKQFGKTHMKAYHTITVWHPASMKAALERDARIAAFIPFTILLYQGEKDSRGRISIPAPPAIMAALGNNDKLLHQAVVASQERAAKALLALKGTKKERQPYTPIIGGQGLMFDISYSLDREEDATAKKEEIQQGLESALDVNGFKLANITNVLTDLEKAGHKLEGYDMIETYSICKLKVIYQASQERPEVGAFAPCSVYFTKKKGEKMIHVGFPPTQNWINATLINNKEIIQTMREAENSVIEALQEAQ